MFRRYYSRSVASLAAAYQFGKPSGTKGSTSLTAPSFQAVCPNFCVGTQRRGFADYINNVRPKIQDELKSDTTFNQKYLAEKLDEYLGLNFEPSYYKSFTPAQIAEHLVGYMQAHIEKSRGKRFEYHLEEPT